MSRLRILVTRPEPGATATGQHLEAAGFAAIAMPLTQIAGLRPLLPASDHPDAVVATSANAIRRAPAELLALLADKPCFAVGDATADAARDCGFRDVVAGEGDAAALAELVIARTSEGMRLAYLTGRVRREVLEQVLLAAGRKVDIVETYDTVAVPYSPAKLTEILGGRIDAVLLYSGKAAETLAALPDAERHFGEAAFFGLSERIGLGLPAHWRKRFFAAGTPDEAALFKRLEAAFPPTP